MNEEIKNILECSMKDVVLEAVAGADIKGIMANQIKEVTNSIARDMFGNYGDFRKELEKKLQKEVAFNLDRLSVPNFGEIAVDAIQAELGLIELENKADIQLKATQKLRNFLGSNKETITCLDLENEFATFLKDELSDEFDCSSAMEEIQGLDELNNSTEYMSSEVEITSVLTEKTSQYSSWKSCTTHLIFSCKKDDECLYEVSMHLNRQRDEEAGETYSDDDYFVEDRKNLYSIIGIQINGRSIDESGTLFLKTIRNELEQMALNSFINGVKIDMNKRSLTEIEEE